MHPTSTHTQTSSCAIVQRILPSQQSPKQQLISSLHGRLQERTLLKTLQNVVEQTTQKQSGIGCKYFVIFLVVARDLTPEIACLHGRIFSLRTYASNDRAESHVSNLLAG